MKVAVYGTLKKYYGNSRLITSSRNHRWLGEAFSVRPMRLVGAGMGFPYVFDYPDNVLEEERVHKLPSVLVEIWDVDEETLDDLDSLEGHPNWYCRHLREFCYFDLNGKGQDEFTTAWIYIQPPENWVPRYIDLICPPTVDREVLCSNWNPTRRMYTL